MRNRFQKTGKRKNRWEIAKKMTIFIVVLLPWKQSAIYSYERKLNPRCVAHLHCKCQELKPKVETNSSFSVLHPSSGVDTVPSEMKMTSVKCACAIQKNIACNGK